MQHSRGQTGQQGETLAAQWLTERGYRILHRNWRHSYYEIDIIAARGEVLHFVEVKTRRNMLYGYPEEAVDRKKLRRMMEAAAVFMEIAGEWKRVQYDVLAIRFQRGGSPCIELFEDVYLW